MESDKQIQANFKVDVYDSLDFPPGYRFCPRDDELIVHYLKKKVMNEPLPSNEIKEVNLCMHSPQQLSETYPVVGEKEWYFFTPRDKKYINGTRPNRAAGTGYWKATGADRPINHNGSIVGFRKALVFYHGKRQKGKKTNWIMHEYRVNESRVERKDGNTWRLDSWVLCRIYQKVDKSLKTIGRELNSPLSINDQVGMDCDYEGTTDSIGTDTTFEENVQLLDISDNSSDILVDSSIKKFAKLNVDYAYPLHDEANFNMAQENFTWNDFTSDYMNDVQWDFPSWQENCLLPLEYHNINSFPGI
ncbi:nac domain-containing protein 68 [Nicotiana attenuata]|uniref:Nac domain-containing protein 68 n=1 Tax=Nicotiana attenuata TaxID=49451 RepID=A0A314KWQ1_NICAT|nr:nac domain-containing protein 68 [Nicotiana attenuata]